MTTHAPRPSLVAGVCTCGEGYAKHTSYVDAKVTIAVARQSDPSTSWEAARSVRGIRETQAEVLALFRCHGPMTDEEARSRYQGRQSLSGFRTRRSELVDRGLLRPAGKKPGATGRRMIVWEAA